MDLFDWITAGVYETGGDPAVCSETPSLFDRYLS